MRHTVIGFGRLATFDVDLNWLATFAMVAEDLNCHRAAAHLGVTQPAVSKRVAHLEDKLDTRLLTDQQKRGADP